MTTRHLHADCKICKEYFEALGFTNDAAYEFEAHVLSLHEIADHARDEHGCDNFI